MHLPNRVISLLKFGFVALSGCVRVASVANDAGVVEASMADVMVDANVRDTIGNDASPPPLVDDPAVQSGQRLRRYYVAAEGGASISMGGFWDSELGGFCMRTETEQGLRCMPVGTLELAFLDAACAGPEVLRLRVNAYGVPDGPFRAFEVAPPTGTRYFRTTSSTPLRADRHYRKGADGRCYLETSNLEPYTFYPLEAIALSRFASFTEGTEARSGGLSVRRLRSEDGAEMVASPSDTVHRVACAPSTSRLCEPSLNASIMHRDATCTMPIGYFSRDSEPQSILLERTANNCEIASRSYYATGAEIQGLTAVYGSRNNMCNAMPATGRAFVRGEQLVPETAFPHVLLNEVGEGVLRARSYTDAARVPLVPRAELRRNDRLCILYRREGAPGAGICVTEAHALIGEMYSDSACTQSLVAGTPCFSPTIALRVRPAPHSLYSSEVFEAFEVSAQTHQGVRYQKVLDTCILRNSTDTPYFQLGAARSLDAFPAVHFGHL